jgi:hypothetical protein
MLFCIASPWLLYNAYLPIGDASEVSNHGIRGSLSTKRGIKTTFTQKNSPISRAYNYLFL